MKKNKIISSLLVATMAFSCLSACGSSGENQDSAQVTETSTETVEEASVEPVTLRFSWWGGDSRHEATIEAVNLYMEQNPNVTIEVEYSGWDGYKEKLVTQLAGNTAADIIQVDYSWIYELYEQDSYFTDPREFEGILDLSGFEESVYSGCWVGDELQGLPTGLNVTTLIVDTTFFEEYGLDSSDSTYWTWDKVLEVGTAINAENEDNYLLNEFPSGSSLIKMMLAQKGQEFVTENYEVGCTEEDLIEALEMLEAYIDNGVILPYEESAIYAEQTEQFPKWLNDEMGMFIQVASTIPSYPDMELDVMLVPTYEDAVSSGASIYPTNLLCINSNSENAEEAAKFLDFFYNDEECIEILADVRGVPVTDAARTILEETGVQDILVSKAIEIAIDNPGLGYHEATFNSELSKIISDNIELFGYGEKTVEETATNILTELEAACATLRE
ncbi:MAG: ABC transporter substrate-binding protein [Eubacteriales bacterium]